MAKLSLIFNNLIHIIPEVKNKINMIGIKNNDLLLSKNICLIDSCAIPNKIPANSAKSEFIKS